MLSRYINGASVLPVSRGSANSTPRRSSHAGRFQGTDGTAYPILGNRPSPDESDSAGDGHDSAPS